MRNSTEYFSQTEEKIHFNLSGSKDTSRKKQLTLMVFGRRRVQMCVWNDYKRKRLSIFGIVNTKQKDKKKRESFYVPICAIVEAIVETVSQTC